MNAPLFRETLLAALEFMPRHRARTKRGATLTLDSFLEEGRWLKDLSPSALDLVLMGHRYAQLFRAEMRAFHAEPLKPALLEDLLQVLFAALLSRDRTGPHVIVNEGVEAAKKAFGQQTASVTNAFLRGVLRKLDDVRARMEAEPQVLLGPEITERWKTDPELLRTLGAALAERPPPGISSFDTEGNFDRRPIGDFREGKTLQAMDVGSWMLMRWVTNSLPALGVSDSLSTLKVTGASTSAPESFPTSGARDSTQARTNPKSQPASFRVLDACAAPGGKTLAFWTLAKKIGLEPELLAVESNARRLNLLRNNLKRWKLENNIASFLHAWGTSSDAPGRRHDGAESAEELPTGLIEPFDVILADLPCTGSGTLHTRPDLLEVDFGERLDALAPLQENILRDLLTRLKPGGALFVSICSVDPAETNRISRFLKREPEFLSWKAVAAAIEKNELPAELSLPEGIVGWKVSAH